MMNSLLQSFSALAMAFSCFFAAAGDVMCCAVEDVAEADAAVSMSRESTATIVFLSEIFMVCLLYLCLQTIVPYFSVRTSPRARHPRPPLP